MSPTTVNNDQLAVSELFCSIQGESTRAGLPCLFIRLAGCNLRCSYCDSTYTWQEPGRPMDVEEIMQWVRSYPGIRLVEVTGGEPLLQDNVYPLIDKLVAEKRDVLVETGGSLSVAGIPANVSIILDVKTPGSGMADKNDWSNIDLLRKRTHERSCDEIKFVLCSEEDYNWARSLIAQNALDDIAHLLFSPVQPFLRPARLAELMVRDQVPARLQLQLHRIIWPEEDRGV